MLSTLQRRIARIVAGLPEAEHVALAGGAALIVHGIVDRQTDDLDFFSTVPDEIESLHATLERSLLDAGLHVTTRQSTPSFVRLIVDDGTESTIVDLAWDVRLYPAVDSDVGLVVSEEELVADKTLALFGRAEARDFIDVHRLAGRHGIQRLCELAVEKDAGFTAARLAESLARFDRLDRTEFDVDDAVFAALTRWVGETRHALERETSRPPESDADF